MLALMDANSDFEADHDLDRKPVKGGGPLTLIVST